MLALCAPMEKNQNTNVLIKICMPCFRLIYNSTNLNSITCITLPSSLNTLPATKSLIAPSLACVNGVGKSREGKQSNMDTPSLATSMNGNT